MSASKVYFTDMRCPVGTGLLDKLKKLIEKAGIDSIDMDNKFVAIKIHFGEPGNLSFLRPNFAKVVADKVTSLGGRPFLTDCNTLYVGRRKHALEHLAAAQENGFSPLSTGCQMIIADGLKGTDEMEVPLEGCDHFQSAFIGRAIMDADIFISLTHFKGHELTGFGGAIKNIGMGCGSRAGKMAMHSIGKPSIGPPLEAAARPVRTIAPSRPSASATTTRPASTMTCAPAAAAASACATSTPSAMPSTPRASSSTSAWPNTPRPSSRAARTSM